MAVNNIDIMIKGGTVLTLDGKGTRIDSGAVAVSEGRIVAVGTEEELREYKATETLSAQGGLIMPGLINCHTHAAMTLFRGMADDLPLMEWLQEHIFPAEARLCPEFIQTGTELACAEMIRGGVTTFVDMYLWEDTVAQAADKAGLRALMGEVLYDFPSPHYGDISSGFDFTADFMAQYREHPRLSVMVMPHALYTCSPSLLEKAWQLAGDNGADMHIHLSESAFETAQVQEAYGRRPVAHLEALGLLSERLLVAHAVDLTDDEISLLSQRGVRAAHCPESNMKLASGVARLPEMIAAGMTVGLGTDGTASNNDLSLLGEMRSCALIHKVTKMDPTAAPASLVLDLATGAAARAVGLGDQIGSLAVGKKADIIVLDLDRPHMVPLFSPESHLAYTALPSDVRHTVVEGKVLMADRELRTIDLDRLKQAVVKASEVCRV